MTPEIERLIVLNRRWLALFIFTIVCLVLYGVGSWTLQYLLNKTQKLTVVWRQDGSLGFGHWSDGPFVVTHLVTVSPIESGKAVAQLPQPIVIIDSEAGAKIGKAEMDRLTWVDFQGRKFPRPQLNSSLRALYYRPLRTETSN